MNEETLIEELCLDLKEQGFGMVRVIDFLYGGCFDEIIKAENL